MNNVYIYAVSYDLGFAPNPFSGLCSLACCKPNIRERAQCGDWIIGLTGVKLKPALRCIFAMIVTQETNFDDYWDAPDFATRRPVRNGTPKKLVGDNIYHRETQTSPWLQENSVHSQTDGEQCPLNTAHDTRVNRVLLSNHFVYFGSMAPSLPQPILDALSYKRNPRDYRRYSSAQAKPLTDWLKPQIASHPNQVLEDPIDFSSSWKRFSQEHQRMV